jgi:hypothetical protein
MTTAIITGFKSFQRRHVSVGRGALIVLCFATALSAQTSTGNPTGVTFPFQQFSDASGECKACHPRQYFEMKQAVHFGYRNISPIFNGLEVASNFFHRRIGSATAKAQKSVHSASR